MWKWWNNFLDEIDKIASGKKNNGQDPSKEGVQRDLLPIVEGSSVQTKFGQLKQTIFYLCCWCISCFKT